MAGQNDQDYLLKRVLIHINECEIDYEKTFTA